MATKSQKQHGRERAKFYKLERKLRKTTKQSVLFPSLTPTKTMVLKCSEPKCCEPCAIVNNPVCNAISLETCKFWNCPLHPPCLPQFPCTYSYNAVCPVHKDCGTCSCKYNATDPFNATFDFKCWVHGFPLTVDGKPWRVNPTPDIQYVCPRCGVLTKDCRCS